MAQYSPVHMSRPSILRAPSSLDSSLDQSEPLCRSTRGRFMANEEHESGQRYVRFNVHELGRLAAEAVGSKSCINITKYPENMYNKTFLLTMNNGVEAIAKLPTPNAGLAHFTTASEVATMDFLRNILSTPVPKVYAWSSKAEKNSVGMEYIIMEKLPGVPLDGVWAQLGLNDRIALAKSISEYQAKWMSVAFENFGSLYYASDLDGRSQSPLYTKCGGVPITNPRFAVGPSVGRVFMDDRRSTVKFNRGPWSSVKDYHEAIGQQQLACVQSFARIPKSPFALSGPGTYQPSRDKKRKALQSYLAIVQYLLPTDRIIEYPSLWHPDLQLENIFVDPKNLTKVVGIIDWQAVEVAPLFAQVRRPDFLDYEGLPTMVLDYASLLGDLAQLDSAAEALDPQLILSAAYVKILRDQNPGLHGVVDFVESPSFKLLLLARNLLVAGEALYLDLVMDLEQTWAELPGVTEDVPFPFDFSDDERAEIVADARSAMCGMDLLQSIKERATERCPDRAIVQNGRYEESRDATRQMQMNEDIVVRFVNDENSKQACQDSWRPDYN